MVVTPDVFFEDYNRKSGEERFLKYNKEDSRLGVFYCRNTPNLFGVIECR